MKGKEVLVVPHRGANLYILVSLGVICEIYLGVEVSFRFDRKEFKNIAVILWSEP